MPAYREKRRAGTENRILFFSGSELASCIKISFSLEHRISNNWGVLKKKKSAEDDFQSKMHSVNCGVCTGSAG